MVGFRYYSEGFLLGRAAVVPESEFPYWEKQALSRVDAVTFGRVGKMTELPEKVKDCICAIAETLYNAEKSRMASMGASGPMTSYSNDGESGSFAVDSESLATVKGTEAEIKRLVTRYLATTGLLYAAVPQIRW